MFIIVMTLLLMVGHHHTGTIEAKLSGVKCVVSGRAANTKYSVPFKQGRIFFDCNASRLKFEREPSIYSCKANHQLVVSGQYAQALCPIKHTEINDNCIYVQVMGVRIRTCCSGCLRSLESRGDLQKQASFVFSDPNFTTTFGPVDRSVKKPNEISLSR